MLASEEYSKEPLSVQMEGMTLHWLTQHHSLFSDDYVDQRALIHLIKRNIKQVPS